MNRAVLILRPEPGASETAERAKIMGLETLVFPLYAATPLPWAAPAPSHYDAILFTSANAPRHAGDALQGYTHLPAFAVGDATARAARSVGFADVTEGDTDIAGLIALIHRSTHRRLLHVAGKEVRSYDPGILIVDRIATYAMDESGNAGTLAPFLAQYPLVLLHSPRAAARFGALVTPKTRAQHSLVAISSATLDAAGHGWHSRIHAPQPSDAAMLAIALQMCQ